MMFFSALGAMLSRLVCKDNIRATPPRKHAEALHRLMQLADPVGSACFRGDFAGVKCLVRIRESMAPES
jgi:hypothetical protein